MSKTTTGIRFFTDHLNRIDRWADDRNLDRSAAIHRLTLRALNESDEMIEDLRKSPAYRAFAHLAAKLHNNPEASATIEQNIRLALADYDEGLFAVPEPSPA